MPDKIELSKSDFVSVMAAATGRCGPWLPGEEPIRGWIEPDPEACRHWLELVTVMRAADTVIARTIERQDMAEVLGGDADAAREGIRAKLMRELEEICGSPPRLPIRVPTRRPIPDPEEELSGIQVLVFGVRLQAAAEALGDHVLAPAFADAADVAFEQGVARTGKRR